MKTRGSLAFALAFVALTFAAGLARAADTVELKVASLAPKGSVWAKELQKFGKSVEEKTEKRVKLTFYFGGSQGDECDAVRKMKLK